MQSHLPKLLVDGATPVITSQGPSTAGESPLLVTSPPGVTLTLALLAARQQAMKNPQKMKFKTTWNSKAFRWEEVFYYDRERAEVVIAPIVPVSEETYAQLLNTLLPFSDIIDHNDREWVDAAYHEGPFVVEAKTKTGVQRLAINAEGYDYPKYKGVVSMAEKQNPQGKIKISGERGKYGDTHVVKGMKTLCGLKGEDVVHVHYGKLGDVSCTTCLYELKGQQWMADRGLAMSVGVGEGGRRMLKRYVRRHHQAGGELRRVRAARVLGGRPAVSHDNQLAIKEKAKVKMGEMVKGVRVWLGKKVTGENPIPLLNRLAVKGNPHRGRPVTTGASFIGELPRVRKGKSTSPLTSMRLAKQVGLKSYWKRRQAGQSHFIAEGGAEVDMYDFLRRYVSPPQMEKISMSLFVGFHRELRSMLKKKGEFKHMGKLHPERMGPMRKNPKRTFWYKIAATDKSNLSNREIRDMLSDFDQVQIVKIGKLKLERPDIGGWARLVLIEVHPNFSVKGTQEELDEYFRHAADMGGGVMRKRNPVELNPLPLLTLLQPNQNPMTQMDRRVNMTIHGLANLVLDDRPIKYKNIEVEVLGYGGYPAVNWLPSALSNAITRGLVVKKGDFYALTEDGFTLALGKARTAWKWWPKNVDKLRGAAVDASRRGSSSQNPSHYRVGHTYTLRRDAGPVPAGMKVVLQQTPATGKVMAYVEPISKDWCSALMKVRRSARFRVPIWFLG